MKILILGGYGTFGGRLAYLLAEEERLTLLIAGRSIQKAKKFCEGLPSGAQKVPVFFDRNANVEAQIREINPDIVIDAMGPFQVYGDDPYRVVKACIVNEVDYMDLADGSDFVKGIRQFDQEAKAKNIYVLSGVSSFPVLTAAVVRKLSHDMTCVNRITGGIAPSPYAGVGLNVIRAIASYAGKPVSLIRNGKLATGYALTETMRYTICPPGYLPLNNTLFSLLVSMWAYGLSRLTFRYAVLANLIILVGYEYTNIVVQQRLETETGTVIFILHNFFFLGANVIGMFTGYYLERYTRQDFLQKYTIQAQRDQADKLLYNVLPETIAERLKQNQETIAEEFNSASVLFADIVNFTPISARFGAYEVVNMLNDLFSRFDELVDKYGVEKIQVAGDAYMVAAGVPTPRLDHATVLAQLALDMLECVEKEQFLGGKHPIEIRIGLNSGSLIAGVIGRKKYYYALWGDMVNIASRMQSHGTSGKIQITRAMYELIKDEFECQYIGKINIKGKGPMEAWHLLAKKEERSLSHA